MQKEGQPQKTTGAEADPAAVHLSQGVGYEQDQSVRRRAGR